MSDFGILCLLPSSDMWITFALILCIWILYRKFSQPKNLPPGPRGLPIIGYLPWIPNRQQHEHFTALQEKYGPLVSFYVGQHLVVILGNYDIIREAYVTQGDIFAGKPRHSPMEIDGDETGISVSDGPIWREQRRFVLKTLRDYGVGKQNIEPQIKDEVLCFLKLLSSFKGEPTDLRQYLGTSISNNICSLEFGQRFEYTDSDFIKIKSLLEDLTLHLELIPTAMFFTWVKKLPWTKRFMNYGRLQKLKKLIYEFIMRIMNEHKTQFDTSEHRDLIYSWLDESLEKLEQNPNITTVFDEHNLLFNLLSLFVAGSQTVVSTLLTSIYLLSKYPHIQERCRQEIYNAIGTERLPSMDDRLSLPYVEATLMEVQRVISVNPLGLVHRCMQDTTLQGYHIPKDAVVFSNLYAVHYDPKIWQKPQEFRPERFLNDQNQVINQDRLIPFSIGKRACIGMQLAKMELFVYFAAFFQNFRFEPPEATEDFHVEYVGSVVRTTDLFKIRAHALETSIL